MSIPVDHLPSWRSTAACAADPVGIRVDHGFPSPTARRVKVLVKNIPNFNLANLGMNIH